MKLKKWLKCKIEFIIELRHNSDAGQTREKKVIIQKKNVSRLQLSRFVDDFKIDGQ